MAPHYLLDADRFLRLGQKNGLLLRDFGTLKAETLQLHEIQQVQARLPDDKRKLWESLFCEELLLMLSIGEAVPNEVIGFFREVCLFDIKASFHELLGKACAMAVFPFAGGSAPGWGHVWVVEGLKKRVSVSGFNPIPSRLGLAFSTSHTNWDGASWQLAGCLAVKALESKDSSIRAALARDWIVTGAVKEVFDSNPAVSSVRMGNKLELESGKRTWLIPRSNVRNVSPAQQVKLVIHSATDVCSAWNLVTGQGTKQGDNQLWPTDVDQLHMLIGGNIKAQIASVLLTPTCKKIVLWTSENEEFSQKPAEQLREVIALLDGYPQPEIRALSFIDIAESEQRLSSFFKDLDGNQRILFNITSGNRLMSYAVQTIARLYPNVELIYREISEKTNHKFTHLLYTDFPPYSGSVTGVPSNDPINWDFVYGAEKYKDVDEFICQLFHVK